MSKRRLNKQQTQRIQHNQTAYQLENLHLCKEGLILSRFGKQAEVETEEGELFICAIRTNIDSLVAGDKVLWQKNAEQGVVVSVLPRHSILERYDRQGLPKAVAANITQLIIVISPKPDPSWSLLDSYLVLAEYLNLKAVIVCNKVDYPIARLQQSLKDCYNPLAYSLLFTSCTTRLGVTDLEALLAHQTSIFVGQSGVGKSSLINALLPKLTSIAPTGPLSSKSALGCHTTSNSRFYHLPYGGAIIDSPGVREFKLGRLSKSAIIHGFIELKPLAQQCKYRNCNHHTDAGCAIRLSLKNQKINPSRYESLLLLLKELAID